MAGISKDNPGIGGCKMDMIDTPMNDTNIGKKGSPGNETYKQQTGGADKESKGSGKGSMIEGCNVDKNKRGSF